MGLLADRVGQELAALLAELPRGRCKTQCVAGGVGVKPSGADSGRSTSGASASTAWSWWNQTRPVPLGHAALLGGPSVDLPAEATWRRVRLAPDVELHFRPGSDLARAAAIRRLIAVAMQVLGGGPDPLGRAEGN